MGYYTIAEMKASYEQKRDWEKQFPVSRFIFRPVSFALASFLSRFTNSPETVAWAGLAVGLAASGLLLNLGACGPWPGIAGLFLFALLDAVDGNMARVTKCVTLYGKMLDGMLGRLAEGLYMPALACGLYMAGMPAHISWLVPAAGFGALCAMLYSGLIESTYDRYKIQKAAPTPPDVNARIGSSRFRNNPLYAVFINLNAFNVQVLLLAFSAGFGARGMTVFIYSLAGYYVLRLFLVFPYYMRKASQDLR